MSRAISVLLLLLMLCLSAVACDMGLNVDADKGGAGQPCLSGRECHDGLTCIAGVCLEESSGGGDWSLDAGQSCTRNRDCHSDLSCLPYNDNYICTARCDSDAACADIWTGSECLKNEKGEFICIITEADGDITPNGDEDILSDGDIDSAEVDNDETAEEDAAEPACVEDSISCDGRELLIRCDAAGRWVVERNCLKDGLICLQAECVEPTELFCYPGETRCFDRDTPEMCNIYGTAWERQADCPSDYACLEGQCVNMDEYDFCLTDYNCSDDEYCFRYDDTVELGQCLSFCDQYNQNCPAGFGCDDESECVAIEGYCTSNADCEMYQFCDFSRNVCQEYCFVPGQSCPEGSYCNEDSNSLTYGQCLNTGYVGDCVSDADCYSGQYCHEIVGSENEAYCRDRCINDHDCYGEETCIDGECYNPCPPCMMPDLYDNNNCVARCPMYNECSDDGKGCVYTGVCTPPPLDQCGLGWYQCCPPQSCNVWQYGVIGVCI